MPISSVESAIRQLLLGIPAVTSRVGNGDSARIRPYVLDEKDDTELPSVILEVNSDNLLQTLDGKEGRSMVSLLVHCRSKQLKQAHELAEAVRTGDTVPATGLAGYTGPAGGLNIDAWRVRRTVSSVPIDDGSDTFIYTVTDAYMVTYQNKVP